MKLKFTDVLDAGCGSGFYSKYITTKFPNAHIVALDFYKNIFEIELKTNSKLNERIVFVKEDYKKISFCEGFDLILNINALGKDIDDKVARSTVLKNFYRALRHNGVLLLYSGKGYDVQGGLKRIRRDFLLDDIQATGFKIDILKHTFGPLGSFAYKMDRRTSGHKLLRAFIIPLLKVIMYCDTRMNHKVGNGLLVVARKP